MYFGLHQSVLTASAVSLERLHLIHCAVQVHSKTHEHSQDAEDHDDPSTVEDLMSQLNAL